MTGYRRNSMPVMIVARVPIVLIAMMTAIIMAMPVVVLPVASIALVIHRGRVDDPRLRIVIDRLGGVIDPLRRVIDGLGWVIRLGGVIASPSPMVTGDGDAGSGTQRTTDDGSVAPAD